MNEFINILGVRIKKSIIKKYYVDEKNVVITVLYNKKGGETHDIKILHDGMAPQVLRVLDEIFVKINHE